MNTHHSKSRPFGAGRTGLFPGSCLPRGRHPDYPAAQASLPTLAFGCGCGRRPYIARSGVLDRNENALRQTHKAPAMKGSPVKSNRPPFSWWLQSSTNGAGRRVITLWRSPSDSRSQSSAVTPQRAAHRKTGVKLRVRFVTEQPPAVVRIKNMESAAAQGAVTELSAAARGALQNQL